MPTEEIDGIERGLADATLNPMETKKRLGRRSWRCSTTTTQAAAAQEEFERVFQRREEPEEAQELAAAARRRTAQRAVDITLALSVRQASSASRSEGAAPAVSKARSASTGEAIKEPRRSS